MLMLLTFGGGFIIFLYYLFDNEGFNTNMYNAYFTGLNTYHYYAIQAEGIFEYYNNLVIQDAQSDPSQQQSNTNIIVSTDDNIHENEIIYSYYPYVTQHTLSYYNYIPNINMIDTSKNPILFLRSYVNDDYKYLQFNDISLNLNKFLPIKTINNGLFLQIEFIYDGITYDISLNSIAPFLVNNNYIFNKKFTKWFAQEQFHINVEESYTIKIIDESINMFEFNENQYICLENDSYSIKEVTEQ
tara:strand:- start:1077 stop:1805 length:729 start_codon:yes stop_codon:yes gene_type:complete